MNEEDCIAGEYYWVVIEYLHTYSSNIEIAKYTRNRQGRHWEICGDDALLLCSLDSKNVPLGADVYISKIISHVERPAFWRVE